MLQFILNVLKQCNNLSLSCFKRGRLQCTTKVRWIRLGWDGLTCFIGQRSLKSTFGANM